MARGIMERRRTLQIIDCLLAVRNETNAHEYLRLCERSPQKKGVMRIIFCH